MLLRDHYNIMLPCIWYQFDTTHNNICSSFSGLNGIKRQKIELFSIFTIVHVQIILHCMRLIELRPLSPIAYE